MKSNWKSSFKLCLIIIFTILVGVTSITAQSPTPENEPYQDYLFKQKKEAITKSFERLNAALEQYKIYYDKLKVYRGDHPDYFFGKYNNYDFVPNFDKNELIVRLDVVDTMDNEYRPMTYQRQIIMELSGTKVNKFKIEVELADLLGGDDTNKNMTLLIEPANLDNIETQTTWFHYSQKIKVSDKDTPYIVKNKILTKVSVNIEDTIAQLDKVVAAIKNRFRVDSAEQPAEFKDFMEIVR